MPILLTLVVLILVMRKRVMLVVLVLVCVCLLGLCLSFLCLSLNACLCLFCLFCLFLSCLYLCFVEQEDDDARAVVLESLIRDGMNLLFNLKFIRVEHDEADNEDDFPTIRVVVEQDGVEKVGQP